MNRIEAMVASVVLALASGSALQLSAEMARAMVRTRALGQGLERLEGELLRAERQLELAAATVPADDPRCDDPAGLLVALADGGPATVRSSGAREVTLRLEPPAGSGLKPRERLLTPAAFGLCTAGAGGQP
jgi:hypothetical protein